MDTGRRLDIDFCVALAHAEHHGIAAAVFLLYLLHHVIAERNKYHDRDDIADQQAHHRRHFLDDIRRKLCAGFIEAVDQIRVIHNTGLVTLCIVLIGKRNL